MNPLLNWNFIACCLSNLLFYTAVYVLVPVLPLYLVDEFRAETSVVGVILSLFAFTGMFIRPFSGFLVDTFRRKPLYLLCYFLFTAYFAGYLLASTLLMLGIVRAMQGLIFSIGTTSAITVAIDLLSPQQQGRGIGIFGVTTSAGILFGPVTGLKVLEFYSFQEVFAVALTISTIALLIGATIRMERQLPRKPASTSPASFTATLKFTNIILIRGLPMALCVILVMFLYGALIHYLTLFVREHAITAEPGFFFVWLSLGLIFGRLAGGWLVDAGYLMLPVIFGKVLLTSAVFVLWADLFAVMFYLSAALFGFGYGIIFPSYQTMFIRLANKEQRGIAVSTYRTATDFGTGFAILCGGVIAQFFSFFSIFLTGAVLALLSLVLFIAMVSSRHRRRLFSAENYGTMTSR